jgi:hypothetical protein
MDTREEMWELWSWDRLNRGPRGLARGSGGVAPSGPSPSRRPGGHGLTLRQPVQATGLPSLPFAVRNPALSGGRRQV